MKEQSQAPVDLFGRLVRPNLESGLNSGAVSGLARPRIVLTLLLLLLL